ncbi:MAG: WD40 repeat domain-containing protein [Mangrovibacterium sp.]
MMKKKIFTLIAFLFIVSLCHAQKRFSGYPTDHPIIYGLCFTSKGEVIAIADNNTIKVYSTNSRRLINEFKNGHKNQILAIDISKDNTFLVSGGKDSLITLWDFRQNKILRSLSYQKGIITSVQISPDCRYLVSGGTDHKVYLYDLSGERLIHEFNDHAGDITSVIFSPDGKLIASASEDKTVNIYDLQKCELITSLKKHRNWVRDIAFNGDGTKLISCGDDSRRIIWDVTDLHRIRIDENSKSGLDWIMSADFQEDNKTYVLGGMNGKILIHGKFAKYKIRIGKSINNILFIPNSGSSLKVAAATRGRGVVLIDARNMKFISNQ